MSPACQWKEIEAKIDSCQECFRIGGGLLIKLDRNPGRPPQINQRPVLFLSEAPPPTGGFWTPHPAQDDLRENLFGILRECGVTLPADDHAVETLNAFVRRGFLLVQAVKWPLKDSARRLRPVERDLINHTVQAHLLPELEVLRPLAIVCLGKVACYTCSLSFPESEFRFGPSARLEDVRGRQFRVKSRSGFETNIYVTLLPVKRVIQRMGERQRIAGEIQRALCDHWDPEAQHVI